MVVHHFCRAISLLSSVELTKSHEAKRESTTVASASANSLPQQHSPKISGQGETGDANADNESVFTIFDLTDFISVVLHRFIRPTQIVITGLGVTDTPGAKLSRI